MVELVPFAYQDVISPEEADVLGMLCQLRNITLLAACFYLDLQKLQ